MGAVAPLVNPRTLCLREGARTVLNSLRHEINDITYVSINIEEGTA
jgi:hypothetical protein